MKARIGVLVVFVVLLVASIVSAKLLVYDPDTGITVEINGTGVVFDNGRIATGRIIGTSADTKPSDVPKGTFFMEQDTNKLYWWTGVNWQEVAGAGEGVVAATFTVASNTSPSSADFVCDGVDDQVEINQAIEACDGVNYCEVLLLNGTFYISNSINITKDKVILKGAGATIRYENGFVAIKVTGDHVKIESITIQGEGVSDTTQKSHGILFDHCSHFEVADCILIGIGSDGICGVYAEPGFIHDNQIYNAGGVYGAIHPHGEHEWVITNNYIVSPKYHGIRHGWIIANNYIRDPGSRDASIIGGDDGSIIANNYIFGTVSYPGPIWAWANNTVIVGNIIDGNGVTDAYSELEGILVKRPTSGVWISGVIVANNIVRNMEAEGIYIDTAENILVSGNTLINVATEADGNNAITLVNSTNVLVCGNIIDSPSASYGIAESGTSDYNIICRNIVSGTTKYSIAGSHTYCDEHKYTALPSDGFAVEGKPVWYFDGTTEYLAIWNGTAWVKTALS